jgi:glycosyltransferase involved in cell wall biosynthesis
MQPTISVIIATYKRPHLITRALDSIAAQTLKPHEIIVVDDASGDHTEQVVAAWSKAENIDVAFIQAETNGGAGAARNLAMRRAKSELIAFLDSDDAYFPDALEILAAPLMVYPKALVSFADAMQHWDDGRAPFPMMRRCLEEGRDTSPLDPTHPKWRGLNDPQSVLLTTTMIPTCAALFRRSAAEAVGLMPEYRHGEDWIFWLKLTARGDFICQFVDVATVYRQGDNQTDAGHAARNAQMGLNALLKLRGGHFNVPITENNRRRLEECIAENAANMRYHFSAQGFSNFWRMLGSEEAKATGGRWCHLVRDPKSLLRALYYQWA